MITKEINPHFDDFIFDWNYKTYFLVGGYGSSKSYHIALKVILKMLEEKRTALVVREVYDTHRESTYSLLEEIIEDLGLSDLVQCRTSPLQIRFPNGSKIIFKGMDKPAKLKSIHNISLIWIEECSELKYDGYKELLGRARHPSLPIHFILSTNPVGDDNWSYTHFFKDEPKDIFILDDEELYEKRTMVVGNTYYHHSLPEDNLFLPQSYIEQLDELKIYDPDLYRIARKGRFGINGIRVLPQFEVMPHRDVIQAVDRLDMHRVGMDFGFETSYNAIVRMAIDHEKKYLYIYWEYYKNKMTDDRTAEEIIEFRDSGELIRADSAEPKTIQYYKQQSFNMIPAKKGPGSRLQNTKKMKRFKRIICSSNCTNTVREWKNLTYAIDRKGNIVEDQFNRDPHTFEAAWYGLDGYEVSDLKGPSLRTASKRIYGI